MKDLTKSNQPSRPLVFIPTYNERENVQLICNQILELGIPLDLLFIDDNSPDGTGQILDELSRVHPNVKILHRTGKNGVGSAHYAGIQYAYDQGYTDLVTMDCDFTHPPQYIPEILSADSQFDIVVGSRYMQERSLEGWNLMRKFLTHTGHFLTVTLLDMKYDATGAFRYYRLNRIPRVAFDLIQSQGYSFFFESLFLLQYNQFRIHEIPIVLPPRTYGHSKMSYREVWRSVRLLFGLYITTLFRRKTLRIPQPACAVLAKNGVADMEVHPK